MGTQLTVLVTALLNLCFKAVRIIGAARRLCELQAQFTAKGTADRLTKSLQWESGRGDWNELYVAQELLAQLPGILLDFKHLIKSAASKPP